MILRANANFKFNNPRGILREQICNSTWLFGLSPPLPPPPILPDLVYLRIAPIRLSIKIIMLQLKYKNDIRMQECHPVWLWIQIHAFTHECVDSRGIIWGQEPYYGSCFGSNIFEILSHITHYIISLQNEISRFSPYERGRSEYTKSFLTLPWKSKGLV